jgi:hypothetical protein
MGKSGKGKEPGTKNQESRLLIPPKKKCVKKMNEVERPKIFFV